MIHPALHIQHLSLLSYHTQNIIMNLSTTSVLLFLLSHTSASTEDKDTSALLRGGQSDTSNININNNQHHHRELRPPWKTQGCKIDGEKIGIYIGGGIGKFMLIYSLCTSCVPQMLISYVHYDYDYFSVRPII